MTTFRRRNAITAYSTPNEALALRTFSRLAQNCHHRIRRNQEDCEVFLTLYTDEGIIAQQEEAQVDSGKKRKRLHHYQLAPAA